MAIYKRGRIWWYEFVFDGKRIRRSTKTAQKRLAQIAEAGHHRQLEVLYNCTMPDALAQAAKQLEDPDGAEDILDKIQAILRKRGAALLIHEETKTMVVAVPHGHDTSWRAIGQCRIITPDRIDWRPIAWRVAPPS